ncbi:cyclic nucleotide-binding domain-containing protein 1 [Lampetra fluviatilis]
MRVSAKTAAPGRKAEQLSSHPGRRHNPSPTQEGPVIEIGGRVSLVQQLGDLAEGRTPSPFERIEADRQAVSRFLHSIPELSSKLSADELRTLNCGITLESWPAGATAAPACRICTRCLCVRVLEAVTGAHGDYVILKGAVVPNALSIERPFVAARHSSQSSTQPPCRPLARMGQGEYFGSLECSSPEWRDAGLSDCRVWSVTTESPCELMRVSVSEFVSVRERIATQDRMAKRSLIQACPGYEDWPTLPIAHLAELLQWKTFPSQHSLDPITKALILQTAKPTFGDLTQEAVNDEFARQELRQEWRRFKLWDEAENLGETDAGEGGEGRTHATQKAPASGIELRLFLLQDTSMNH